MLNIKSILRTVLTAAICLIVFAGTFITLPADKAFAADEYTYTVTVNAGKEGSFNGKNVVKFDGLHYGDSFTVNINDLGLELKDSSTYYARGLKISGHDNDEIARRNYQSYTFTVTGDESFSVAYGMKGGMVKYVVHYVDENGDSLHDSETFYGMPGDYPVVSYQYVEGYLPDAYNKGKTLVEDESQNVFTFTYSRTDTGTPTPTPTPTPAPTPTPTPTTPGAGANANANAGNNANNNGPAAFQNLDDGAVPLNPDAGNNGNGNGNGNENGNGDGTTEIGDNDTPKAGIFGINPMILILIGGLLAALIALIVFLRTRGGVYEDDDEDEDEEDEAVEGKH